MIYPQTNYEEFLFLTWVEIHLFLLEEVETFGRLCPLAETRDLRGNIGHRRVLITLLLRGMKIHLI